MLADANSSARILDAALTLFSERGYEATSTREICELAGITKPTLYYFYESKEGIYRALVRSAMAEFLALVETGLSSRGDFRQRIQKTAQLTFEHTNKQPRVFRFVFATVYTVNSPFAKDTHEVYQRIAHLVAESAQSAVKQGELTPGDNRVRTLVLMGAMAESISNCLLLGRPKLTRALADSIVDTLFDGWEPPKKKSRK
jgi:AcrR family transcriptional regulator